MGAHRQKEPERELPFAAPDVVGAIAQWLLHLGAERRMSPKTLEAYDRDVRQFLAFLADHFGQRVTLSMLRGLTPQDVRAFMAHRRGQAVAKLRTLIGERFAQPQSLADPERLLPGIHRVSAPIIASDP